MQLVRPKSAQFILFASPTLKLCLGNTASAVLLCAIQCMANPEPRPIAQGTGWSKPLRLRDDALAQRTGLAASTIRKQKRIWVDAGILIPVEMSGEPASRSSYARYFCIDYAKVPVRSGPYIRIFHDHLV